MHGRDNYMTQQDRGPVSVLIRACPAEMSNNDLLFMLMPPAPNQVIPFVCGYGYREFVDERFPMLEIEVLWHEEAYGHTWYECMCHLARPGSSSAETVHLR